MSIVNELRDYLTTYDQLEDGALFNVDQIKKEPTNYSISPVPSTVILEEYITGDSLRAYDFAFFARNMTDKTIQYIENEGFFEAFAEWLEAQTKAEVFPELDAGKTAEKIEALQAGFLTSSEESGASAVYEIQCRLTYRQEGA